MDAAKGWRARGQRGGVGRDSDGAELREAGAGGGRMGGAERGVGGEEGRARGVGGGDARGLAARRLLRVGREIGGKLLSVSAKQAGSLSRPVARVFRSDSNEQNLGRRSSFA